MDISFVSAKPGQGVTITTILAAMAFSQRHPTVIIGSSDTFAAVGSTPVPDDEPVFRELSPTLAISTARPHNPDNDTVFVHDNGDLGTRFLVTTGCYLALRRAVEQQAHTTHDGIIHIAQPGRAITANDIEQLLGMPIVASVAFDPIIARAVDAGLLVPYRQKDADASFGTLLNDHMVV